jgi:hypothetical protein
MPFLLNAPACASAAPIKPPISVWDELEGMPNHHVRRFQVIAAIRPANITSSVIKFSLTDLAMVLPILNSPIKYFETKKAAKLKNAAHNTAWKGVSTFVETIVAIEFAAS